MKNDKLLNEVVESLACLNNYIRNTDPPEDIYEAFETLQDAIDVMQKREAELVEALQMNHLQNALCYGKEYTTTVLWSKTEAALANYQNKSGG